MNELSQLLEYDSLNEAEKVTGKSYKEDNATGFLGMMLAIQNGEVKNAALKAQGDSTLLNTLSDYLTIIKAEGFEVVLTIPFQRAGYKETDPLIDEKWYVAFHKADSILLVFETYRGKSINGGNFYYNWKSNDPSLGGWNRILSTCYFKDGVAIGSHDCREAIRYHIKQLRDNGTFLKQWIERPLIHILNNDDYGKGYDFYNPADKERTSSLREYRLSLLPEFVLNAITPN